MNSFIDSPYFLGTLAAIIVYIAILAFAWIIRIKTPSNDAELLDFLDRTGYLVRRIPSDQWAVIDHLHKIVGEPAENVRGAIRSAGRVVTYKLIELEKQNELKP